MKRYLEFFLMTLVGLLASNAQAGETVRDPVEQEATRSALFTDERILRLDLDVDGDSVPETFIARDLEGDASKAGHSWRVYKVDSSGMYRGLADGRATFEERILYSGWVPELDDYALLTYFPASSFGGSLIAVRVRGEKVSTDKIATLDLDKPEDRDVYQRYFGSSPDAKVEVISIPELRSRGYALQETVNRDEMLKRELEEYERRKKGASAVPENRAVDSQSNPKNAGASASSPASALRERTASVADSGADERWSGGWIAVFVSTVLLAIVGAFAVAHRLKTRR